MSLVLEKAIQLNLGTNTTIIVIASAIAVGVIEEGTKFGITFLSTNRNPNLNEPVDGMIYASAVGLGFAAIETTMLVLRLYHDVFRYVVGRGYSTIVARTGKPKRLPAPAWSGMQRLSTTAPTS